MAGRRHVVTGNRWPGKGAEEKVGHHGEFGDAGERSSSESLSTVTATATAAHSAQQALKRLLERHTHTHHTHKDPSKDDVHNPSALLTDSLSVPTTTSSGSDSPTPTQFSPTSTLVMASPPSTTSKLLASPSKSVTASALAAAGRTYDGKLIAKEMARYGSLAHTTAALPSLGLSGASPSASTLALSTSGGAAVASAGAMPMGHSHGHGHGSGSGYGIGADSALAQLHVLVLPLFNHEQLHLPLEDLNALVRLHIEAVTSRGPQRTLVTLEHDISELINAGMVTLNAKLMNVDDEQLLNRVVELWGFFWDKVLPYIEGVFLPLQTSDLLINLYRTAKLQRPSSPITPDVSPTLSAAPIDVRTVCLRAFRDKIIVPIAPKLEARINAMARKGKDGTSAPGLVGFGGSGAVTEAAGYQHPRLQQMLLVLHSQAQRARRARSLTAPAPTLSTQELAIRKLLDAITRARNPGSTLNGRLSGSSAGAGTSASARMSSDRRPPSFLSSGAPRDRRGRVAGKANRRGLYLNDDMLGPLSGSRSRSALSHRHGETFFDDDDDGGVDSDDGPYGVRGKDADDPFASDVGASYYGGATPRGRRSVDVGAAAREVDAERERKRNLLESLRSPNTPDDERYGGGVGDEDDDGSEDDYGGTIEGGSGRRLSGAWPLGGTGGANVYAAGTGDGEDLRLMNWDPAQAAVERIVGMAGSLESEGMPYVPPAPPLSRRRMT